jgi:hypothetical protein
LPRASATRVAAGKNVSLGGPFFIEGSKGVNCIISSFVVDSYFRR